MGWKWSKEDGNGMGEEGDGLKKGGLGGGGWRWKAGEQVRSSSRKHHIQYRRAGKNASVGKYMALKTTAASTKERKRETNMQFSVAPFCATETHPAFDDYFPRTMKGFSKQTISNLGPEIETHTGS